MKVKSEGEVAQSCPTLSDPIDCSVVGPCVILFLERSSSYLELLLFFLDSCAHS